MTSVGVSALSAACTGRVHVASTGRVHVASIRGVCLQLDWKHTQSVLAA